MTTGTTRTEMDNQATVMWDDSLQEQLQENAHKSIDGFVSASEEIAKAGLKGYLLATIPTILKMGALGLKNAGFLADSDKELASSIGESIDPYIDASVEKTGNVARQGLNWSAENSLDSTQSIFGRLSSYFRQS